MPAPGAPISELAKWQQSFSSQGKGYAKTSEDLAAAKVVPITEAIKAGPASQKALQAVNILSTINSLPGAEKINSGPFAEHWLDVKRAIGALTGMSLVGGAPAESIQK